MLLRRSECPILVFNLAYIIPFAIVAIRGGNDEFLLYVAVVLVIVVWILVKQRTVRFGAPILWGLSIWGLLHMAGGNIHVGQDVLYGVWLIPRVVRYDQFVHSFGFGTTTLVCYHLLRGFMVGSARPGLGLLVLVALMGCGVGALNEIIEFIAVGLFPHTGVGGYENTMWDLTFNLFGAVAAAGVIAVGPLGRFSGVRS